MKIGSGDVVVAVLQNPREKVLGILGKISPAGVFLRAIDIEYFEEWTSAIKNGEPHLPMQDCFYPLWRIERIYADTGNRDLPSMSKQFRLRTGKELSDL